MEKEEIFRYLKVGRDKTIKVDRKVLSEYNGICREITIFSDIKIRVDYLDKGRVDLGEGEITFYFHYENYEDLFSAVEEYTGNRLDQWENYNNKDYEWPLEDYNLEDSWYKLEEDFANRQICFPKGYNKMGIRDLYWNALYNNELEVHSNMEQFEQWLRRKMKEEE